MRSKEICLLKYNVDSPMEVPEIQIKCEQSCIDNKNFGNTKTFNSCLYFKNGISVSKAQDNLAKIFSNFELNYHFNKYYLDLYFNKIAIEYNGKGHDMGVRLNKIIQEDFEERENIKKLFLKNNGIRLIEIIDKKIN